MSAPMTMQRASEIKDTVYRDGICGMPGAFEPEIVSGWNAEILDLFEEASSYEGGTINRGRNRKYFSFHLEKTTFAEIILAHPWFKAVNSAFYGDDWVINEVACDISHPGSLHQPWHRDFRRDIGSTADNRILATAFNIPLVPTTDENGPLELVHGTQWDQVVGKGEMFPNDVGQAHYSQHEGRTLKYATLGSMSVRTPLAIHRGTPNHGDTPRPVLVVTTYSADAAKLEGHLLPQVTRKYFDELPASVQEHLNCRIVDELTPIIQTHDIEGLVMGEE